MNIAVISSFIYALWTIPTLFYSTSPSISQFKVHSLPDAPSLPPSWAGRLPVPNTEKYNAMFFWLVQAENAAHDDNLIIWFNGGPGCSSLIGLTTGNGPVSFDGNSTRLRSNPHSWSHLGHVLYVDQPVGTGFSTASNPYPARDNNRVTSDFYAWLQSFLAHFPHLRHKRIHLVGESYAGIYIPYIASSIVANNASFPLDLRSISLGDATIGNHAAMSTVTVTPFLQSQHKTLHIPPQILSAFTSASQTCGFDHILAQANTFPPTGPIPIPGNPENLNAKRRQKRNLGNPYNDTCELPSPATPDSIRSAILDSDCYGACATFATASDYLLAAATSASPERCFDMYDVHNDDCDTADPLAQLSAYFSRRDVQVALNLSPAGSFTPCNGTILETLLEETPEPPTYAILPSLVERNISLHVYSGEYDLLVNHFGSELSLQNMTWGGAQGFSQRPERVFFADDAAPGGEGGCGEDKRAGANGSRECRGAGIWGNERGVSYHLFWGAGHTVFANKPREMFAYVRDVVLVD